MVMARKEGALLILSCEDVHERFDFALRSLRLECVRSSEEVFSGDVRPVDVVFERRYPATIGPGHSAVRCS